MKQEIIISPGQRGWRCSNCGKIERSHTIGDEGMIQKVIDHVCSEKKWWQFWDKRR